MALPWNHENKLLNLSKTEDKLLVSISNIHTLARSWSNLGPTVLII